jgi:hypothetical protein
MLKRYTHDCTHCVYLGPYDTGYGEGGEPEDEHDLWWCPSPSGLASVISRHSSEPSDYTSGSPPEAYAGPEEYIQLSADRWREGHAWYIEAMRRAIQKGLYTGPYVNHPTLNPNAETTEETVATIEDRGEADPLLHVDVWVLDPGKRLLGPHIGAFGAAYHRYRKDAHSLASLGKQVMADASLVSSTVGGRLEHVRTKTDGTEVYRIRAERGVLPASD